MTAGIIACGNSAKDWGKQQFDLSIGVNDAFKFGYPLDQLVIVNFKHKFKSDRLNHILKTKAKIWTHTSTWKKDFPNAEVIKLTPFNGHVRQGLIYSLRTSPIVAISLAVKQRASEIIIWGIDFKNHSSYSENTKQGQHEIRTYLRLFEQLQKQGINIYRGADGSAFDFYLPLWTSKDL